MKIINLSKINSIEELHLLFKNKLNFPDYYGNNWDAFFDMIGEYENLDFLKFTGLDSFEKKFPKDAKILYEIIKK